MGKGGQPCVGGGGCILLRMNVHLDGGERGPMHVSVSEPSTFHQPFPVSPPSLL